jgi:hypothetical protein
MTTLAQMALRVARLVTDVLESTATAGNATTITDTERLVQQNQWFDKGTVWPLTGNNAGKVAVVSSFAANVLTFPTLTLLCAAGNRYAVARAHYPYDQIVSAIQSALDETFIVSEAVSDPAADVVGDGTETTFAIPGSRTGIVKIEMEDPQDDTNTYPSSHWKEDGSNVIFSPGYAPLDDWIIRFYYRAQHSTLTAYADTISAQVHEEWLRWKAAEYLLYWGVGQYGNAAEYRIEERLNRVLNHQKERKLRARNPIFNIQTAGARTQVYP